MNVINFLKQNRKVLGVISIFFMYLIFFLAIKYIKLIHFSYDLLFFATLGIIFVSLHFFLDIKKMYNWIFDFRYLIGIVIFSILVIGGYHGSSMNIWNVFVSPNEQLEGSETILGIPRGIRSDEWLVSTPHTLSQLTDEIDLSNTNNLINAKENKVDFFPRLLVKDIGIITSLNQIGYIFLPKENAFSFSWYFDHFAAFFIAIELLMLITKKNKLYSVLGAFLLVIGPPNLWWHTNSYMLYAGGAILTINKFINTKNKFIRILLAAILGVIAASYVKLMYPAWMIPYAYLFVLIFIWLLIENKNKIKWTDLLYLIITIIVCAGLFLPAYINSSDIFEIVSNTAYPGKRSSYGGGNWKLLFNYIHTIYYPFLNSIENPCELSQYLSLFPIPIIMGINQLIKNKKENKKKDWFLIFTISYALFLSAWCFIPLPKFISQLTLLTMSTVERAQLVVGYTCIFILIYLMSKYEDKRRMFKLDKSTLINLGCSFGAALIIAAISNFVINEASPNSLSLLFSSICVVIFTIVIFLFIQNKKKMNFILFILLLTINTISILLIQPLDKGLEIFYDSPFAKEIRTIVDKEPDAKFLSVNEITIQNYLLPNGAKSINSTNFVPNLELWQKLDSNDEYNDIYNRYAHVLISLTNDKTSFELVQSDMFKLHLNYNDICKTGANYIVSYNEIEKNDEFYIKEFEKDKIYIYKTICD